MDVSLSLSNINLCSFLTPHTTITKHVAVASHPTQNKKSKLIRLVPQPQHGRSRLLNPPRVQVGVKCASQNWEPEAESQPAEVIIAEEEVKEEWMEMEKCNEREGMVELLECLEREAIMGEDEGRHPTDYHRRAQIFDKSSRVFQDLKERNAPSVTQPHQT